MPTPTHEPRKLSLGDVIERFHQTFRRRYYTILIGGFDEPLYRPARDGRPAEIQFRSDYVRSALHEIAHWCIAGAARREQDDYGYWYRPDGRSDAEQQMFYRVEARPQAVEWTFSLAAGIRFRLSLDNVNRDGVSPGDFEDCVRREFRRLSSGDIPPRAAMFLDSLGSGPFNWTALDPALLEQPLH